MWSWAVSPARVRSPSATSGSGFWTKARVWANCQTWPWLVRNANWAHSDSLIQWFAELFIYLFSTGLIIFRTAFCWAHKYFCSAPCISLSLSLLPLSPSVAVSIYCFNINVIFMKMFFKQKRNFFPPSKLKCEAVACLVEHNADVLKGIEERHIQRRVLCLNCSTKHVNKSSAVMQWRGITALGKWDISAYCTFK